MERVCFSGTPFQAPFTTVLTLYSYTYKMSRLIVKDLNLNNVLYGHIQLNLFNVQYEYITIYCTRTLVMWKTKEISLKTIENRFVYADLCTMYELSLSCSWPFLKWSGRTRNRIVFYSVSSAKYHNSFFHRAPVLLKRKKLFHSLHSNVFSYHLCNQDIALWLCRAHPYR